MSTPLTVNGVTYNYPANGDQNWGVDASGWASAVTTGMLQKAGGSFFLTSEVDFGTVAGLKSLYYKSRGTNVAAAGVIRLASTEILAWRNNANGADLPLTTNSSDQLLFNSVVLVDLSSTQTLLAKTLTGPNGSVSAPTYSFSAATTLGMYNDSGVIGISGGVNIRAPSGSDGTLQVIGGSSNRGAVIYAQQTAGSTTGSAYFCAQVASGNTWSFGAQAASNVFKISNADGFGSSVLFTLGSSGAATFFGNVTGGTNSATFNSVVLGSSANTISALSTIVNTGTLTLPTTTDTLVGRATTDTLTNKTLTSPVIASIVNSGTLTLPTSSDTLVGRATTDTLTNKTLTSPTINGGTHTAITGLGVRDTSAAFDVTLAATSSTTLTAGRTLTIDTVNTSSTFKLGANLTVTGASTLNGTLSGTSSGTNTGDQTITLTGNVTGSGTGSFATTIAAGVVTNAMLAGSITDGNLATSYIKADGSRALSANWAAGNFQITANSVLVGSAANTIGGLTQITMTSANFILQAAASHDASVQLLPATDNFTSRLYARITSASTSGAAYYVAQQDGATKWSMGMDLVSTSSAWAVAATDGFGTAGSIYLKISSGGLITHGAGSGTQQHAWNTSTATSATAGSNGAVPAQVAGYIVWTVNGSTQKIPYYNS